MDKAERAEREAAERAEKTLVMQLAELDTLDERFTVIFTSAQMAALRATSHARKIGISAIVRTAVMKYCRDEYPEFERAYIHGLRRLQLTETKERGK